MRLTLNTKDVKQFELAEPGPYQMTIDSVDEPARQGDKNTLGVNIHFAFADPDLAEKHGTVMKFYPIEGKGAGFLTDLIKVATGNEIPVGKEGGEFDFDADELIGSEVIVDIGNQPGRKDPSRVYNTVEKVVAA